MTDPEDRFDDGRDAHDEERDGADETRCDDRDRSDDLDRVPPGGVPWSWTHPMSLDDQLVIEEALAAVLGPAGRWPDPVAFDRTDRFALDDGTVLDPGRLGPAGAADLLSLLVMHAERAHSAAVRDERAHLSTALAWAMRETGVPFLSDLCPLVWLESTALVRRLRAIVEHGAGWDARDAGGPEDGSGCGW